MFVFLYVNFGTNAGTSASVLNISRVSLGSTCLTLRCTPLLFRQGCLLLARMQIAAESRNTCSYAVYRAWCKLNVHFMSASKSHVVCVVAAKCHDKPDYFVNWKLHYTYLKHFEHFHCCFLIGLDWLS